MNMVPSNQDLRFGKCYIYNSPRTEHFLHGKLDDIRVYLRELTPLEITTLFNGNVSCVVDTKIPPCKLYYPNGFTPNSDNQNDVFKVESICKIIDFHIIIFNRWGDEIFESHDSEFIWLGMKSGKEIMIGVYPFKIKGSFLHDGQNIEFEEIGAVNLIR